MKKNLLTLGMLAYALSANAQVLTYVGDGAKMFVSSGALVYSGGDWEVNSATAKTVENKGNIIIVGDYKKGTVTNAASDGQEFLNVYNAANDYGQVKILNTAGTTDARMAIERPVVPSQYFGAVFAISFPYKDNVKYLMKSVGKSESDFKGTCPVGTDCGSNRYKMTLFKWNNDKIVQDAVVSDADFKAGDYYSINLIPSDLQSFMSDNTVVPYKGMPAPAAYSAEGKSVIYNMDEYDFSPLGYNSWKTKINQYNEKYESYLGYYNSTNKNYGKNVYRFGNPYTSNIDLSAISGNDAWLHIINNNGNVDLKTANQDLIGGFYITKRTSSYDVDWNPITGSNNSNGGYYKVVLDENNNWTGAPEALLIQPFETFNLNFPLIDPDKLGTPGKQSRIVNVRVNFNDAHKTFAYTPTGPVDGVTGGKVANRSAVSVVSNPDSFYQAEIFLTKNNSVIADPAYLVGSNYYTESATNSSNTNGVFVYGINNGMVAYDSKKDFNEFNSLEYIGKPLGLGFNDLQTGDTYELRFNLYEGSIFNRVKNLSDGIFYILDKNNNSVSEISADKSFSFVASDNADTRFEIYWKEVKSAGSLATNDAAKGATYVYKDTNQHKVRFEKIAGKAKVEVYDMSGKLVLSEGSVSTDSDLVLNLTNKSAVYIVKVIYQNGEVRTLKMIN
ncbi:T9SS type A sorting domain-containing protein [Weeksellaceae bacterium A-14]